MLFAAKGNNHKFYELLKKGKYFCPNLWPTFSYTNTKRSKIT